MNKVKRVQLVMKNITFKRLHNQLIVESIHIKKLFYVFYFLLSIVFYIGAFFFATLTGLLAEQLFEEYFNAPVKSDKMFYNVCILILLGIFVHWGFLKMYRLMRKDLDSFSLQIFDSEHNWLD